MKARVNGKATLVFYTGMGVENYKRTNTYQIWDVISGKKVGKGRSYLRLRSKTKPPCGCEFEKHVERNKALEMDLQTQLLILQQSIPWYLCKN
ncbi:unnamed protein product [Cylicocyclus nassatus]|uniref:Uncharacterized protein n=1 Tax=Cylicocyclus nassatus TaxID=53992 RepID=A0AA36M0T4_CYLNA|nr:unnamed protein product [Cylicocyclus nassatus]